MARSARDSRLETRTARQSKCRIGKRYFKEIGDGLTIVYRRTAEGYGTWSAKLAQPGGKYVMCKLGASGRAALADDQQEANGVDVLTFYQAQEKARQLAHGAKVNQGVLIKPSTVEDATKRYVEWYREHRRAVNETERAIDAHVRPALGDKLLSSLTTVQLREWLDRLATAPARLRTSKHAKAPNHRAAPKTADEKRARRATANRVLNILKAILNRAFNDGLVADDTPWRKVKPFPKADEARIRFLTDAEAVRLVNACPADLRALVRAALLTGARFGELVAMRAVDVNLKTAQIYISQSKSGRPRHVPLNPEGVELFRALTTGKTGSALVFTKKDGTEWGKNHHVRSLTDACRVAKVSPSVAFHELRHTYASHLAQAGVDLLTISKLLGHADTRITSKHYAHLADKTLADAVLKLPNFGDAGRSVVAAVPVQAV
ncbi:MAG: site-specific integrase [Burkholderiales bacterium]|nr:site-specific integrase [Burkholderiales bacterium]